MSEIAPIDLPPGGLEDLAISPERWIASAGGDGTLRIRQSDGSARFEPLHCSSGQLWACAWHPDGEYVAGVGSEGIVWIWKCSFGPEPTASLVVEETVVARGVWALRWHPSGRNIALGDINGTVHLLTFDPSGDTPRLAVAARREDRERGHDGRIQSLAWHPDDSEVLLTGGFDGLVCLHQTLNGTTTKFTSSQPGRRIRGVAWLDHNRFVAAGDGGLVEVFDRTKGREPSAVLRTSASGPTALPDAPWLWDVATGDRNGISQVIAVGGDGAAYIWSAPQTGGPSPTPLLPEGRIALSSRGLFALEVDVDGTVACGGASGRVRLVASPFATTPNVTVLDDPDEGHRASVLAAAYAPDGGKLALALNNGSLLFTHPESAPERRTVTGDWLCAIAWRESDGALAVGTYDGKLLIVDLTSTGPTPTWQDPRERKVESVTWISEETCVVGLRGTGGQDTSLVMLSLNERGDAPHSLTLVAEHSTRGLPVGAFAAGELVWCVTNAGNVSCFEKIDLNHVDDYPVMAEAHSAVLHPDGDRILIGGGDGRILAFDLASKESSPIPADDSASVGPLATGAVEALAAGDGMVVAGTRSGEVISITTSGVPTVRRIFRRFGDDCNAVALGPQRQLAVGFQKAAWEFSRPDATAEQFGSPLFLDQVSSEDKLNWNALVDYLDNQLKELRTDPGDRDSLFVLVHGSWGAGKSSFSEQVRVALGSEVVWAKLNAWEERNSAPTWFPITNALRRANLEARSPLRRLGFRLREAWFRQWSRRIPPTVLVATSGLILLGVILLSRFVDSSAFNDSTSWLPLLVTIGPLLAVAGSLIEFLTSARLSSAQRLQKTARDPTLFVGRYFNFLCLGPRRRRRSRAETGSPAQAPKRYQGDLDSPAKPRWFTRLRTELSRWTRQPLRPMVLYIDDLDRCEPQFAADFLSTLHLLGRSTDATSSRPPLAVIVASDRRALAAAHDGSPAASIGRAPLETGYEYLGKLFQLVIRVPPVSPDGARHLIRLAGSTPEPRSTAKVARVGAGPPPAAMPENDDSMQGLIASIAWSDSPSLAFERAAAVAELEGDTREGQGAVMRTILGFGPSAADQPHLLEDYVEYMDRRPRSIRKVMADARATLASVECMGLRADLRPSFDDLLRFAICDSRWPGAIDEISFNGLRPTGPCLPAALQHPHFKLLSGLNLEMTEETLTDRARAFLICTGEIPSEDSSAAAQPRRSEEWAI